MDVGRVRYLQAKGKTGIGGMWKTSNIERPTSNIESERRKQRGRGFKDETGFQPLDLLRAVT
jgi:hypothetical protein